MKKRGIGPMVFGLLLLLAGGAHVWAVEFTPFGLISEKAFLEQSLESRGYQVIWEKSDDPFGSVDLEGLAYISGGTYRGKLKIPPLSSVSYQDLDGVKLIHFILMDSDNAQNDILQVVLERQVVEVGLMGFITDEMPHIHGEQRYMAKYHGWIEQPSNISFPLYSIFPFYELQVSKEYRGRSAGHRAAYWTAIGMAFLMTIVGLRLGVQRPHKNIQQRHSRVKAQPAAASAILSGNIFVTPPKQNPRPLPIKLNLEEYIEQIQEALSQVPQGAAYDSFRNECGLLETRRKPFDSAEHLLNRIANYLSNEPHIKEDTLIQEVSLGTSKEGSRNRESLSPALGQSSIRYQDFVTRLERYGWQFANSSGSHRKYTKEGRSLSIVRTSSIMNRDTLLSALRNADVTPDELEELMS
jgi:predicted RNA binding protein YcfA (HicA-like mRNA interferase family)